MSLQPLRAGLQVGDAVAHMTFGAYSNFALIRARDALQVPAPEAALLTLLTSGLTASIGGLPRLQLVFSPATPLAAVLSPPLGASARGLATVHTSAQHSAVDAANLWGDYSQGYRLQPVACTTVEEPSRSSQQVLGRVLAGPGSQRAASCWLQMGSRALQGPCFNRTERDWPAARACPAAGQQQSRLIPQARAGMTPCAGPLLASRAQC